MTRKTPSEFTSHDDWLSYVRCEIAVSDQPYTLAFGRMELFRSFYRMQRLPFPIPIAQELERIEKLQEPEQTAALEEANDEMLRSLTGHLLDRARPTFSEVYAQRTGSPQERIQELLQHLAQKNPYFALWVVYKRSVSDYSLAGGWDEFLLQELGTESGEEIAFAHAMVELDKLLNLFHDRNWVLPGLSSERILFLHSLRGPERMLQTRAVLGMLTAELAACTSA
jgi:hypothetical protein